MSASRKPNREYLTPKEVARELGVTVRTVRNWIHAKQLVAKKVGGVVRILRTDLEHLIKPAI